MPAEKPSTQSAVPCLHPRLQEQVQFDEAAAEKLKTATEVREKFPRVMALCPDCGGNVIMYASYKHYIMGDW